MVICVSVTRHAREITSESTVPSHARRTVIYHPRRFAFFNPRTAGRRRRFLSCDVAQTGPSDAGQARRRPNGPIEETAPVVGECRRRRRPKLFHPRSPTGVEEIREIRRLGGSVIEVHAHLRCLPVPHFAYDQDQGRVCRLPRVEPEQSPPPKRLELDVTPSTSKTCLLLRFHIQQNPSLPSTLRARPPVSKTRPKTSP